MSENEQNPEFKGKHPLHKGSENASPYPVSRLAPRIELLDLAQEIAQADEIIAGRVSSKLQVIAEQLRSLQAQARSILEEARQDQRLNHAKCAFKRIPGRVYHLYVRHNGEREFSMLSPQDWGGRPPCPFEGSYRLEPDMSWTAAADALHRSDNKRKSAARLLEAMSDFPDFKPEQKR